MGLLQLYLQPGGINPALYPAIFGVLGPGKTIVGDEGNDTLVAPLVWFFTQLNGGEGNDVIVGGIGLDIMTGAGGSDVLFGRGGKDYFFASRLRCRPDLLAPGRCRLRRPVRPQVPGLVRPPSVRDITFRLPACEPCRILAGSSAGSVAHTDRFAVRCVGST